MYENIWMKQKQRFLDTFNLTSFPYQQYKKICVSMHDMYNPTSMIFPLVLVSWYKVKHTTNVLTRNWKVIVNLNFLFSITAKLEANQLFNTSEKNFDGFDYE